MKTIISLLAGILFLLLVLVWFQIRDHVARQAEKQADARHQAAAAHRQELVDLLNKSANEIKEIESLKDNGLMTSSNAFALMDADSELNRKASAALDEFDRTNTAK